MDWRRRCVVLGVGVVVLIVPLAAWALGPLPSQEWTAPAASSVNSGAAPNETLAAIDRRVFDRNLWWSLTKTGDQIAATESPKATVLPLEIDLVGITDVGGTLFAALYDRRADRLLLVRSGDSIGGAQVKELTRDRVTLARGDGELVLARRRPGP